MIKIATTHFPAHFTIYFVFIWNINLKWNAINYVTLPYFLFCSYICLSPSEYIVVSRWIRFSTIDVLDWLRILFILVCFVCKIFSLLFWIGLFCLKMVDIHGYLARIKHCPRYFYYGFQLNDIYLSNFLPNPLSMRGILILFKQFNLSQSVIDSVNVES